MEYELLIVGGGPAGLSAAYQCQKKGIKCLVLEQADIFNTIYNYPHGKPFFSETYDLELEKGTFVLPGKEKPNREQAMQYIRDFVEKNKIEVDTFEKVLEVERGEDGFKVVSEKGSYEGRFILMAIGNQGSPRKLGVAGEDLAKVEYRLVDPKDYQDLKVLVVGGGDSAIEAAVALKDNNEVTLSYRKPEFARPKENNKEAIFAAEKAGQVKIIFLSNVREIREKELVLAVEKGGEAEGATGTEDSAVTGGAVTGGTAKELTLPNDAVIIQAGAEPNLPFLERIGLELENNKVKYDPATLETTIPGMYIGGDLTKEPLIKNAIKHGRMVTEQVEAKLKG